MMSNNPNHVLSRLLHRGDYFPHITEDEINLWKPKIMNHVLKCKHPFCVEFNT